MIEIKDFGAVFNMKPDEIINYFESKGLKTSFDWHEVYEEAHAKAFTVAKMTEIDLLKDTKTLLENALKEGKSYSSFKKEAMELFERKGWVGFKEMTDLKTGEIKTAAADAGAEAGSFRGALRRVELGTPSRIKKIYDCNMNSAYAVGRYKEQLEEIDIAPYLQYMAIMDESTRPEHKALHKKVFRADDPFWSVFYPPNGWNCRCFARSLTKYELESSGLKVENTNGKISKIIETVGNKEVEVPTYKFDNAGIPTTLKADKGWGVNLGVHAWGIDVQAWNKVENLNENLKYQFISKMASNPYNEKVFKNFVDEIIKNNLKPKGFEKPISWIGVELFKKLNQNNVILKNPVIVFQDDRIGHIIGNRGKLSAKELKQAYNIINNPDSIYFDFTMKDTGLCFVKNIPDSDECYKVCTKLAKKHKKTKESVNYISTIGKVKKAEMQDKKHFKKIE